MISLFRKHKDTVAMLVNVQKQIDLTTTDRYGTVSTIIRDLPKGTIFKLDNRVILHKF